MPTPEFIQRLRRRIGHELLWLPGIHAVVVDDAGAILLNRRSDTRRWAVLAGILEPGEEAADGAVREVQEETGVRVRAQRVVSVGTSHVVHYPNGDRAQYVDITFLCRYVSGLARVNDEESLQVAWFEPTALPELAGEDTRRIDRALGTRAEAWFAAADVPDEG